MNDRRKSYLLLLLGLLLLSGARAAFFRAKWKPILHRPVSADVGMGQSLKEVVLELERRIGERTAHEIDAQDDPLNLSRVLRTKAPKSEGAAELAENLKEMRLSCTILSPKKTIAIIKFQGQSYILGVGDSLNGRTVTAIDERQAVLSHEGAEEILVNRPAPLSEINSRRQAKLSDLRL